MVTRDELVLISTESYMDGHTRDVVQHEGKYYVVGSVKCPADMNDDDAMQDWFNTLDMETQMMIAFGMVPLNETFVMEAKWDDEEQNYIPKNECGEHCATGVCNKRLASNTEVGDHDLAYNMLVSHLNA